jgi:hypothetical protein
MTSTPTTAAAAGLAVVAPLPDRAQIWISAWCVLLAAVMYLTWGTARGDRPAWSPTPCSPPCCSRWASSDGSAVCVEDGR